MNSSSIHLIEKIQEVKFFFLLKIDYAWLTILVVEASSIRLIEREENDPKVTGVVD